MWFASRSSAQKGVLSVHHVGAPCEISHPGRTPPQTKIEMRKNDMEKCGKNQIIEMLLGVPETPETVYP
eukprot:450401-Amphidinium_carterae.1